MSFILLSEQDVKVFKGALIYDVRRGRGLADEVYGVEKILWNKTVPHCGQGEGVESNLISCSNQMFEV